MIQDYNPTDAWVDSRESTIGLVREERRRQLAKWGERTYDDGTWVKVIAEEFGELAQEMLTIQFDSRPEKIAESIENRKKEAIQLAAVCLAYVQQLESGSA